MSEGKTGSAGPDRRDRRDRRDGPAGQLEIIAKLIPGEALSVYVALRTIPGLVSAAGERGLFFLGLAVIPLLLLFRNRDCYPPGGFWKYVVQTVGFVAWAFALGSPLGPSVQVSRWIPGTALLIVPIIGSYLFPPIGRGQR
jgi:hypothetical protein